MNQPFANPTQNESKKQIRKHIIEDKDVAMGHYAHVYVTSYDRNAEHYRLDFYQESTPMANSGQINQRLVSRIFLTSKGLQSLAKVLTNLDTMIKEQNKTMLSPGKADEPEKEKEAQS